MTIWQRDWFLNLDGKYQLFVHYLRDHCDHAGVWQPAFKLFEKITGFRIDQSEFLSTVNSESVRVHILENGKWWLTGFIEDQYRTTELNECINPHKGVINSIDFNNIPYNSYGYKLTLRKGMEGVKDKDKNKDTNSEICINSEEGMQGGKQQYELFKAAYPPNGSILNPEVMNWFILRFDEKFDRFDHIISRAGQYATYWKELEPDIYPQCKHIKQAINWLRECFYETDWSAKLVAEKRHNEKEAQRKRGGILG
jgi:hypothetical protein